MSRRARITIICLTGFLVAATPANSDTRSCSMVCSGLEASGREVRTSCGFCTNGGSLLKPGVPSTATSCRLDRRLFSGEAIIGFDHQTPAQVRFGFDESLTRLHLIQGKLCSIDGQELTYTTMSLARYQDKTRDSKNSTSHELDSPPQVITEYRLVTDGGGIFEVVVPSGSYAFFTPETVDKAVVDLSILYATALIPEPIQN